MTLKKIEIAVLPPLGGRGAEITEPAEYKPARPFKAFSKKPTTKNAYKLAKCFLYLRRNGQVISNSTLRKPAMSNFRWLKPHGLIS